jgi:hypothetical protein
VLLLATSCAETTPDARETTTNAGPSEPSENGEAPAADLDAGTPRTDAAAPAPSAPKIDGGSSAPDGSTCNAIAQQGAVLELELMEGPAPVPQGGAIASGTWVATAARIWGAPSPFTGSMAAQTWEISGTSMQAVSTGKDPTDVQHRSATLVPAGTSFTLSTTCHSLGETSPPQTGSYTATATTLSLLAPGTTKMELIFTKK